jgi:hypothetical protein
MKHIKKHQVTITLSTTCRRCGRIRPDIPASILHPARKDVYAINESIEKDDPLSAIKKQPSFTTLRAYCETCEFLWRNACHDLIIQTLEAYLEHGQLDLEWMDAKQRDVYPIAFIARWEFLPYTLDLAGILKPFRLFWKDEPMSGSPEARQSPSGYRFETFVNSLTLLLDSSMRSNGWSTGKKFDVWLKISLDAQRQLTLTETDRIARPLRRQWKSP